MFWYLLLAHFIADFPLQPNWMVRKKTHFWVLFLHVAIHFVTMLVVILPAALQIWPYLLLLAGVHFCIDTGKNWFTVHRPQWRAWPYLIDQACHYLSIGLITLWIRSTNPPHNPILSQQAAVIGIGFLLVTFVYMITERVLLSEKPGYPPGIQSQVWARLYARTALLVLVLAGWKLAGIAAGSQALVLPYPAGQAGRRIFLVDLSVTLLTALLVIWIDGGL